MSDKNQPETPIFTSHSPRVTRDFFTAYPPQIAHDVEIVEQRDGDRLAFIVGSAAAGRFILLGEIESRVLRLLAGTLTPAQVCQEFKRLFNATLTLPTLQKFLGRLDVAGILAGERASIASSSNLMPGPQFYVRWKLFNPDRLLEKMVSRLRWIWTKEFVIVTLLLMSLALFFSMSRPAEVTSYALYTLREHYLAVFVAGILIGFSHEFAHGLTCKAFGGRVTEVGVLMIYYLLPALYCNVSGAYLIPKRSRRLWVIFAGIYWQMLVGALFLIGWFLIQPYTLTSDLAFIFFLGAVVDLAFNGNPLIKLDGYYFLSQLLRLPNLMERSRAYWRGLLKRVFLGGMGGAARRGGGREQAIYAVFGLTSFAYTVGLRALIVFYVGSYLADEFNVTGLAAGSVLGGFYMRSPLWKLASATRRGAGRLFAKLLSLTKEVVMRGAIEKESDGAESGCAKVNPWRRRVVWAGLALAVAGVLCMPWNASVGGYGALLTMPNGEVVVRAPENATLVELHAEPGDLVVVGSLIGRMSNLELEDQIVQAETERVRAVAEYERLLGELRVRQEVTVHAGLRLSGRQHEFDEINSEQEQINWRLAAGSTRIIRPVSLANRFETTPAYPASIAVLQADIDRIEVGLREVNAQAGRSRELFGHGVVSRSELEASRARTASQSLELAGARDRLAAALIEHRRKYTASSIELQQAGSDLRAERMQAGVLDGQSQAAGELIHVLDSRLALLRRRQLQFDLVTTGGGTIYGEELPRMVRRYFSKGEEICRVADTRQLLARIQLPEREIGDVRVSNRVRLRVRAFPGRVFHGVVSKIGNESERDEHNQTTYRVELEIENEEGLLRPGMTAFARIDFGRQMIVQILVHKVKQLLRPETWML